MKGLRVYRRVRPPLFATREVLITDTHTHKYKYKRKTITLHISKIRSEICDLKQGAFQVVKTKNATLLPRSLHHSGQVLIRKKGSSCVRLTITLQYHHTNILPSAQTCNPQSILYMHNKIKGEICKVHVTTSSCSCQASFCICA